MGINLDAAGKYIGSKGDDYLLLRNELRKLQNADKKVLQVIMYASHVCMCYVLLCLAILIANLQPRSPQGPEVWRAQAYSDPTQ